jgi:iron complex outermembrane receptor protein
MWNGFNLNNLTTGQTDFSLVPVTLFSGIQVNLGAMGATGGNGVVAGSVELFNKEKTGSEQTMAGANVQAGSFGKYSAGAAFSKSGKGNYFSVQPFYSVNQNLYPYKNSEGNTVTMQHAGTQMSGVLAAYHQRLRQSSLSTEAWIQQTHRELPATIDEVRSYAKQDDQSVRITVNQRSDLLGFFQANRLGYFYDRLDYQNTLTNESSGFRVNNLIGETESIWGRKNLEHKIKIFVSGALADNSNYEKGRAHLLRSSLGYFFQNLTGKRFPLDISAALKEEINNSVFSIPIAQLGLSTYREIRDEKRKYRFTAKFNAGTVYRFPTLNDLYWYPGGNPNLKPEKGGSANGSLVFDLLSVNKNGIYLRLDLTHYERYMYNWIMWLPKGANWSPQNLQEVWSRGNETNLSLLFGKKLKCFSRNVFNYNLSTIQKSNLPNDHSIGRQLIYTPMYNAVTEWGLLYKGFSLSANLAYYGYRYTSSDNYEYLDPFYLLGARLTYTKKLSAGLLDLFADAGNLLNEKYAWVAQRPALPRNFNIGLSYQWFSKSKQNQSIQ